MGEPTTQAPTTEGNRRDCNRCKDQCQLACQFDVELNQCWGDSSAPFVQCQCKNGEYKFIPGCECTAQGGQSCPDANATTAAPETTQAPTTQAPSTGSPSGKCRHLEGSIYSTSDEWCEVNCTWGGNQHQACCFEASEGLCAPREHHCFCPGHGLLMI